MSNNNQINTSNKRSQKTSLLNSPRMEKSSCSSPDISKRNCEKRLKFLKSNSCNSFSTTYKSSSNSNIITNHKLPRTQTKIQYIPNRTSFNSLRLPLCFSEKNYFIPKKENINISSPISTSRTGIRMKKTTFDLPKEDKIKVIQEKIKMKEKIIEKNLENQKNLKQNKDYQNEKLAEMRKIKLRLRKLILQNQFKICKKLENCARESNLKIYDYLISDRFVQSKLRYNTNYRFDKNDLAKSNDPYDQVMDLDMLKLGKCDPKEIFEQLSDKEKKLIILDPTYFIKDDEYFTSVKELNSKSLAMKINEEDETESKNAKKAYIQKRLRSIENLQRNENKKRTKKMNLLLNDVLKFKKKKQESVTGKYLYDKELLSESTNKKITSLFVKSLRETRNKNKSTGELIDKEITNMKININLLNKSPSSSGYYLDKIKKDHRYIPNKNKKDFMLRCNLDRLLWEDETKHIREKKRIKNDENCVINDFLLKLKDNLINNNVKPVLKN